MSLKKVVFIFFIAFSHTLVAQVAPQSRLNEIAVERDQHNASQKQKAIAYARKHNVPMMYRDTLGNGIYLIGVDDYGLPVYQTTLNAGAAITTGVTKLRTGGGLGLNLEGNNMLVGVWDEARVKLHVEFGNPTRIVSTQGDNYSAHSTHVTGTILATGIDANAKGMAPKAKVTAWDFDNDESEMASLAKPDQTTLLFSNHSYGIVLGFYPSGNPSPNQWAWAGNSSISSSEDYRFGFYSTKSRSLDNIAFNAPYYTMVWAGGNDRAQTGDGTHPPDGNGGTGYDCLGPEGVAKNNITVGAVQKVLNYTGPSSVVMSTFSSWGPTDDGRIKPDLVGAGVGIYSTYVTSAGADTYKSEQGTSMAAPNVTGSLLLLQELYRDLHAGSFMKSATLKALAIHTTKEAGANPGPDYSFGWGLLDVEAAAKVLLAQDQESVVVLESSLAQGETFEYSFEPVQNQKITATIVWTDPAGTPTSPALDPSNKMLVNDLNLLLTDGDNANSNKYYPWSLNPANPSAAATNIAANTRDNVEKIELASPEPRPYKIVVSHTGNLVNGKQDFSLILTFTPSNDPKTPYYWIGRSGNWNDPNNWSLTSGGASAGVVPDINGRVIVDENSFNAANQTITLNADAACASFTWLAKTAAVLSLNGHKLTVDGNFIISSSQLTASTAGDVEMKGTAGSQYQLNTNNNDLSKVSFYINSTDNSSWTLGGNIKANAIVLQQGGLVAHNRIMSLARLDATTSATKTLDLTGATITELSQSTFNATGLTLTTTATTSMSLVNSGTATLNWGDITYDGSLNTQGAQATISGGTTLNSLTVGGQLTLNSNNTITQLTTNAGSSLKIQTGTTQTLTQQTTFNTSASNRLSIAVVGAGTAQLSFGGHFKSCFDYLDVNGVDINGDVTISAGANSTLNNAANWIPGACAAALFVDYTFRYNCRGALTEFYDGSDGTLTSWLWDFGDPSSGAANTSTDQNPVHIYNTTGIFDVKLIVSDPNGTEEITKQVNVAANNLSTNNVIIANAKLFSELTSESYQWYKDGEALPNETQRWYQYNGELGNYFVVIKNGTCSLPSPLFIVSGTEDEGDLDRQVQVYPNPASDKVTIRISQENLPAEISLTNSLGQKVTTGTLVEEESVIHTDKLGNGFYILDIFSDKHLRRKLVIRR